MNYMEKMKEYLDKDAVASKLGLEAKPSTGDKIVSALGLFGVGVLVGAGIALLLAPKSGRDLRQELHDKVLGQGLASAEDSLQDSAFRPDQRTL